MYKRPHHQRVLRLLQTLDGQMLKEAECFFGGGTAIVLLLNEYRESVDIDLLCSSTEGYRVLRNIAHESGLAGFFTEAPKQVRDLRTDRYGIRTFAEIDGIPVKFEIVREDRIPLTGEMNSFWGVPVLSQEDMYAEKLLANADRYADAATANRDIIDLAMMMQTWGAIPDVAWQKVRKVYGESAEKAFTKAVEAVSCPQHLAVCLKKLQMDDALMACIPGILGNVHFTPRTN